MMSYDRVSTAPLVLSLGMAQAAVLIQPHGDFVQTYLYLLIY